VLYTSTTTYLLLELQQVTIRGGVLQAESLDGHLAMPVAPEHLPQRATTHALHQPHLLIWNAPLINTVTMHHPVVIRKILRVVVSIRVHVIIL
jgi:hypothetical protein